MSKIHVLGIGRHYQKPVCGKRLTEIEKAVSRKEFLFVDKQNRCRGCEHTAWVKSYMRVAFPIPKLKAQIKQGVSI